MNFIMQILGSDLYSEKALPRPTKIYPFPSIKRLNKFNRKLKTYSIFCVFTENQLKHYTWPSNNANTVLQRLGETKLFSIQYIPVVPQITFSAGR